MEMERSRIGSGCSFSVACNACPDDREPVVRSSGNTIVLGTIEAELKKASAFGFGQDPRSLTPLIAKAVSVHGGLRLAPPSQSRYSVYFSPLGGGQVKVEISKGHSYSQKAFKTFVVQGVQSMRPCSRAVTEWSKQFLEYPVSFPVNLLSFQAFGKKEIFVSNSLMTSAQPHTAFKKITFNPSWDNAGKGIFFTSNRKVFNNIEHLDLSTRKISNVANYGEAI